MLFTLLLYYLGLANCQKSRQKVRIYADKKPTFLKGAWRLTLPRLGFFENLRAWGVPSSRVQYRQNGICEKLEIWYDSNH